MVVKTAASPQPRACGAVTLLTVTAMVLLAAVAGAYSARSVWLDQLSVRQQLDGQQARLAAEAALHWAAAQLQQAYRRAGEDAVWSQASASACPAGQAAPAWQCVALQPDLGSPLAGQEGWRLQVTALRHLTQTPHVVELQATARKAPAQASLRRSVYVPAWAVLPVASNAALVPGVAATPPATCTRQAWRQALGEVQPEQVRAWSQAQERNGLGLGSQPARSIYWIDSAQDWAQSLGQASAPVLLVFSETACASRCPRLLPGVVVHGTVVLAAACQDARVQGWTTGQVSGQLVAEASPAALQNVQQVSPAASARQAFDLPWPVGIDSRQVQWVAGSFSKVTR
jgi:Tfp pilus assembly protein PilX